MRVLVFTACLLVALTNHALAQKDANVPRASSSRAVNRTLAVVPDGYIRIFQLTGSVRLQGWDRDSLAITGTVNVPAQGEFVITPGKQGAKVSLSGPDEARAQPSHLVIRVPRNSQLYVKTQSAQVSVSDFEGRLDVVTVSGNVEVTGRPREIYLETLGGNATLAVDSRLARVKTGTGQVTLRGTIDDATVSTVSGPVISQNLQLKSAHFESVDGKISFSGDLTQPAALEFINHAGDIELALSPRSLVDFRLSTFNGSFRDDWGVSGKWEKGKLEGKDFSFQLGREPVAEISIKNFKGAMILKRRPD